MVGMGKRIPLHVDPPIHTFYRRVLNPPFQPDNIARHEESIRAMAVELLETLLEAGEGDFIEGFTYHLPMRALCEFLNIPQQDATEIKDRSERYAHALETGDRDALRAESDALYEYARQQVAHRKQNLLNPYQDVLSALLTARHEDNQPIDDEIIVGCLRQLIVAGNLTLTLSIASAVLHLAKDAALQNELRQNPHRIPAAIEEFLRLYPPNQAFARTTTREVEISGQKIPEGDVIAFVWIAANRDPEVFPNPDEFDMERERNPHLSFGHGIHKCLGIALARLEMRIALEELLARTSHFELTAPAELVNKWPEYGPQCLPLRFERLANEAE
jgi:cytochrome P450